MRLDFRLHVVALLLSTAGHLSARPAAADGSEKVDPWVLDRLARSPSGESEFLIVLAEQADLSGAAALRDQARQGALSSSRGCARRPRAPRRRSSTSWRAPGSCTARSGSRTSSGRGRRRVLASIAVAPRRRRHRRQSAGRRRAGPFARRAPRELRASHAPDADRVEHQPGQRAAGLGAGLHRPGGGRRRAGHRLRLEPPGPPGEVPRLERRDRRPRLQLARRHPRPAAAAAAPTPPAPCDDSQHGTHTMGTMVGDDGGANQIGMAPGAKWIGCRNMDQRRRHARRPTPSAASGSSRRPISPTRIPIRRWRPM